MNIQKVKKQPTTPENLARINAMFKAIQPLALDLASRWHCEREFEDIQDYAKVISSALPDGFTLVKMTKSPFGFQFSIGTEALYVIKVCARSIEWKRIA